MAIIPLRHAVVLGVLLVGAAGCGGPTSPAAAPLHEVSGRVTEAGLPDSDGRPSLGSPLNGVRIEILSGTSISGAAASVQGRTATSADGRYSLGKVPPGVYSIRASKDGYVSVIRTFTVDAGYWCGVCLDVTIGTAPHTLYGYVFNSRGGRVPFARVEIINGPDARRVTQATIDGHFRFDGLATSGAFDIRATHPDFDGRTVPFTNGPGERDLIGLHHHQYFDGLSLTPRAAR